MSDSSTLPNSPSPPSGKGTPPSPPRHSRWRRRALFGLAAFLLILGVLLVIYFDLHTRQEGLVQEAVAEVEAVDPRWRSEDLEADRAQVPDERNSAKLVLAAKQAIPDKWPGSGLDFVLEGLPPTAQLNEQQVSALRCELDRVGPARAEARKLTDFPQGRHAVSASKDYDGWQRLAIGCIRTATLLRFDALLRAQENDLEGAWLSTRAALNAIRAPGDDPGVSSVFLRIDGISTASRRMVRMLAQGEAPPAALEMTQRILEDEEAQPLLWYALRGERAITHDWFSRVESGEKSYSEVFRPMGDRSLSALATDILAEEAIETTHAWYLQYMTKLAAVTKLPAHEQPAAIDRLRPVRIPPFAEHMTSSMWLDRLLGHLRIRTDLRATIAALAAERYRLQHGRWPDALDDLVPHHLTEVPTDPFSGKPLLLLRVDQGLVIYSVGQDGKDDGGTFDEREPHRKGADLGVRLWNVDHRRQPPRPEKAERLRAPREEGPD